LIEAFTQPGDIVLDPFCGSGSTLLAAKILGRRYVGVEIDKEYASAAQARL
jgi:DNA modification methylase